MSITQFEWTLVAHKSHAERGAHVCLSRDLLDKTQMKNENISNLIEIVCFEFFRSQFPIFAYTRRDSAMYDSAVWSA